MNKIFNVSQGYTYTRESDAAGEPYRVCTFPGHRLLLDKNFTASGAFGHFYVAYEPDTDRFVGMKMVHMPADDGAMTTVDPLRPTSKKRIFRSDLGQVQAEAHGLGVMRPKLFLGGGAYFGKRTKKYLFVQELMACTLADAESRLGTYLRCGTSDRATEAQKTGASVVVRHLVYGLAKDLSMLHSRGYTHNDLKSDNIFLRFADDKSPPEFLLWDFGLLAQRNKSDCCNICTGAPEVAGGAFPTSKNDIWCLGLTVMGFVYGHVLPSMIAKDMEESGGSDDPRAGLFQAFEALRRNPSAACPEVDAECVAHLRAAWERVRALPEPLARLVIRMLDPNPHLRPTAKDIATALRGIVHVGPEGRKHLMEFWRESRGYPEKVKQARVQLRARFKQVSRT